MIAPTDDKLNNLIVYLQIEKGESRVRQYTPTDSVWIKVKFVRDRCGFAFIVVRGCFNASLQCLSEGRSWLEVLLCWYTVKKINSTFESLFFQFANFVFLVSYIVDISSNKWHFQSWCQTNDHIYFPNDEAASFILLSHLTTAKQQLQS